MSNNPDARPPRPLPPPRPGSPLLGCVFAVSVLGNVLAAFVILVLCAGLVTATKNSLSDDSAAPPEKYYSGSQSSANKVAVVSLEGVILEGLLASVHKQIDQAARDDAVKAVVLRVNSPGGSITASEELHARLLRLRDGDPEKNTKPKPLVVSMGSVAASGGYYVAAPAKAVFAERSTLTGSIGVYVSLPNVKDLADNYGVAMNTIKAGEIKASGSPFAELSSKERQVWQDMVNDAYEQFLTVVEKGRPALTRDKLLKRFAVTPPRPDPKAGPQPADYDRYLADGGIFTAPAALKHQLIDAVGDLNDAVKAAAKLAEVETDYKAVKYEKVWSLGDWLNGSAVAPGRGYLLEVDRLKAALTPRLWFLAPGYEAAGLLTPPSAP